MLPVHAVHAFSSPVDKPKPTVAEKHYKQPAWRAHHAKHNRFNAAPVGETRNGTRRPENDVKVDADDGAGPEGQGQGAPAALEPAQGNAGGPGAAPARAPRRSAHTRPARATHARPAARPDTRPGTGADSGFADADDPALPPEAAAAIREAEELQNTTQQAGGSHQGTPAQPAAGAPGAPGTPVPPAPPAPAPGAPQATTPRGAVPLTPANTGRARPANPVTDESSNHKSSRLAAPSSLPVAYFNTAPGARGSDLVLHVTGGATPEHTVTLRCDPPGGTHPNAGQACADVSKAGGDLAQMPAGKNAQACFMIYSPVTATAQGSWHGRPVSFTKKYPNTCVMRGKTGSVFDF